MTKKVTTTANVLQEPAITNQQRRPYTVPTYFSKLLLYTHFGCRTVCPHYMIICPRYEDENNFSPR